MSRRLRALATGLFGLAMTGGPLGCADAIDLGPPASADPPPPNTPPSLAPLTIPDFPPRGPDHVFEAECNDAEGLRTIGARFQHTVIRTVAPNQTRASFMARELGEGRGTFRISCCDLRGACAERTVNDFILDFTPPLIEPARLVASPNVEGPDGQIAFWVSDEWVLGDIELVFQGRTFTRALPKAYPATLGIERDVTRVAFQADELPAGSGAATIRARDASGNARILEVPLRVDGTPPTVAILSPAADTVVSTGSILVNLSASDPDNPNPARTELFVGGAKVADLWGASPSLAVDTSALPPGATEIRAVAYDDAGNRSATARVSVTIPE